MSASPGGVGRVRYCSLAFSFSKTGIGTVLPDLLMQTRLVSRAEAV